MDHSAYSFAFRYRAYTEHIISRAPLQRGHRLYMCVFVLLQISNLVMCSFARLWPNVVAQSTDLWILRRPWLPQNPGASGESSSLDRRQAESSWSSTSLRLDRPEDIWSLWCSTNVNRAIIGWIRAEVLSWFYPETWTIDQSTLYMCRSWQQCNQPRKPNLFTKSVVSLENDQKEARL